jgi:hypothetical protein
MKKKVRASYLTVAQQFNLNAVCRSLIPPFGHHTYQVGSSLERVDYHDVDLRCILDDTDFDRMFSGETKEASLLFLNTAVSEWLSARTGLPIDFQFQRQTDANEQFNGRRNFVGH